MEDFFSWLVEFAEEVGSLALYIGLFISTLIESTFVPIPAEVTMIPAGYLVQKGALNFWTVLSVSVAGTVVGSYINYWIAKHYGRKLFKQYGKYFFMTPAKMEKLEGFYKQHGALSTFIGRLLPGLRHYISFPAGLAKMRLDQFFFYTALGGAIWMSILLIIGYKIGDNEHEVKELLHIAQGAVLVPIVLLVLFVLWRKRRGRLR